LILFPGHVKSVERSDVRLLKVPLLHPPTSDFPSSR
jgi:hypothetical protein